MTNTLTIEPRTAQEVWALARLVTHKRKLRAAPRPAKAAPSITDNYTVSIIYPVRQPPKLIAIMDVAVQMFGCSRNDLLSRHRNRELVHRRQVIMYAMKKLTTHSYPAIGRFFKFDHTTVLHGVQSVTDNPAKYAHLVNPLMAALGSLET